MVEAAGFLGDSWMVWAAVLGAALVTYASRGLGVLFAGRIDPASPLFDWVGCVAYALLAGLIARMILLPIGPLADVPLAVRLSAAGIALAIFFLTRRSLLLGLAAGVGALLLMVAGG